MKKSAGISLPGCGVSPLSALTGVGGESERYYLGYKR